MSPGRFRGADPPRRHAREAAGRADQLDHGERQGSRATSSSGATRKSSSPSSSFPADKFREGLDATDAELTTLLRGAQERAEDPREAQGEVRARRHAGDSRHASQVSAAGHPALLRGQPAAVLDAGTGARQPHPAEDRRQRRRGGEEAGGGSARQGEGGRRLRAARDASTRKTTPARSRAATSTSSPRARWCRSSTRRRSR